MGGRGKGFFEQWVVTCIKKGFWHFFDFGFMEDSETSLQGECFGGKFMLNRDL